MAFRRTTLADIAKACGVSVNTVSHALKDKPDISVETKKQVRKKADELGYIQNSSASFLRSGQSKSIAIIVGDIANPHFSILIKEMEITARKSGYTCFVLNTDENEAIERDAIVAAISKNVDGIILCPAQKSEDNIQFLLKSGIPFTLIGRRYEKLQTNYVVCDDENSGYLAAEYIHKSGSSKTAVINTELYISSARERLKGIKEYCKSRNISIDAKNIYTISIKDFDHERQLRRIAAKGYDSAICFNDIIALELLACSEKPINIVSFDNIRSKFKMPYQFASITSSKTKMSNKAIQVLLAAIAGKNELMQIVIPTDYQTND